MSEVTLLLGKGTNVDISLSINNGDVNAPKIRYNATGNYFEYSNDGATFSPLGGTGTATLGTWENPVLVGTTRLWEDTDADAIRKKVGSNPTSMTDGTFLVEAS